MLKVLAVDDEAPIRQWLEFCINRQEEFQVVGIASNGVEGLELFKREKPDIVVTDIEMPGMDGLQMLEQMQLMNAAVYAIILTSHDDFSYARKALHLGTAEYILKTEISEESLSESLRRAEKVICENTKGSTTVYDHGNRNHFLQSLAMKKQPVSVTLKELEEYHIPLIETGLVAFDIWNAASDLNSQEILRKFADFQNMTFFSLGIDHTVALANAGTKDTEELIHKLTEQCEKIMEGQRCYIGISDIADSYSEISKIIQMAMLRCTRSFYEPQKHVFYQEQYLKEELKHEEALKASFSKELLRQNYNEAIGIKNRMVMDVQTEKPANIENVKKLFLFFVTSLLHFTKDDILEIEEQIEIINKEIEECGCLEEHVGIINKAFDRLEEKVKTNHNFSPGIQKAIQYMEEHYEEKISLAIVANEISFSPEYLSRLFNKETGVNFVVYLNNVRMKHAVNLLETTNLKVYEVAEKAGYQSLSYFSTAFKKNFGKNPYEYQLETQKKILK